VAETARTRLAVLGSPIGHSRSPAIHLAAYRVLGLDWSYEAIELTGERLAGFLGACGPEWRGLSLTMPLKRDILPLLHRRHPLVDVVGAANTVRFTADGLEGFNTDVYGIVQSFRDAGLESIGSAHVLGAGATAASVLAALAELGTRHITISARTPAKADGLVRLGTGLGMAVVVRAWDDRTSAPVPDAVVSTLPGGQNDLVFDERTRAHSVLLDIAYDPWPSELARSWQEAGGGVISGLEMLVHQAIGQVRVFVGGDPEQALSRESEMLAAMREAIAGPS
jgi:shikimate dehydrogenase